LTRCRYNEITPLLYSETTFHFTSSITVSTFIQSILPQHLNNIRSLSIDWDTSEVNFSASNQKWNDIWDTISAMQSINEVRLIVVAKARPHWHEEFQWKWKHEGISKMIERGELKVDFWNCGVRIPAIFGEDERRNAPSTYKRVKEWGPEWYEI
jgi:hypothetical protein